MEPPILGQGSPRDPRSLDLATRAGNWIDNVREEPLPPAQMEAMIRRHRQSHPNVVLRSAASTYNCAGMAFGSRRTAIDVALAPRILGEDDYRQIGWEEAELGDLVLYFDGADRVSHVGMIASLPAQSDGELSPIRVLSQWGYAGEYVHAAVDVPLLLGDPREVWTDRVPTP